MTAARRPVPPLEAQLSMVRWHAAQLDARLRNRWAFPSGPIEAIRAAIKAQSDAAIQLYLLIVGR